MKGKYLAFIFFFFAPAIISFGFGFLDESIKLQSKANPSFMLLWLLISIVVQVLLVILGLLFKIGTLRYVDSKNNNQEIKIIDTLKNNWKLVLLFFILGIVNLLIVLTPTILFIIPGIVLSIIFQFAVFQLVLRNKGLYSSIAYSLHLVKGRVWTFIKKALYPAIVKILPTLIIFFAAVGSGILVLAERAFGNSPGQLGTSQIVLLVVLGILSLFLIVRLIRLAFISYVYSYYLFLELEKTATPVVEEDLQKTKVKLMWATALSPMIALLIMFGVFLMILPQ